MTPTPKRTHAPTRKELESALEAHFNFEVRSKLGGRVSKLVATEAGIPDRLVLLPGGRIRLVELKAVDGRVAPIQKLWHQRAAYLGTEVVVLTGRAEVDAWIRSQFPQDQADKRRSKSTHRAAV